MYEHTLLNMGKDLNPTDPPMGPQGPQGPPGSSAPRPKNAALWGDQWKVVQGAPLSVTADSSFWYGLNAFQSPAALNDTLEQTFSILPGTYTVQVQCCQMKVMGMTQYFIDGVLIGTSDCYHAAAKNSPWTITFTNIAISDAESHRFRKVVYSKNTQSTGYEVHPGKISIY